MRSFDLSFVTAFTTFNRQLHPFISLFAFYDFRLSRMTRFTLVLGQLSLITLLTMICFSRTGDEAFNDAKKDRLFSVSLLLSFLTLPLPRRFFACLETQLYVMKDSL